MSTPPQQPYGNQSPQSPPPTYGEPQPGQSQHGQPQHGQPQHGQPQQGPPSGYGPPQWHAPRNGLGTAALVLGIIAAVFAFIPLVGIFIAIPLAALAVILGAVGIGRAVKGSATNKGVAISGTVLGAVAVVLTVAMTAAVFGSTGGTAPTAREGTSGNSGAKGGENSGANGAEQKTKAAGVGDTVRSGDLALTVTKVRTEQSVSGDFGYTEKARGKYVIAYVRVQNTGSDTYSFFAGSVYAYDQKGSEYTSTADVAVALGDTDLMEPINPGQSAKGYIAYDVPEKVTLSHIEVSGGFLADPVIVRLK